jgi:hypothetical protein
MATTTLEVTLPSDATDLAVAQSDDVLAVTLESSHAGNIVLDGSTSVQLFFAVNL